eukprot:7949303-Alexandrium_andersonii.AAC.1
MAFLPVGRNGTAALSGWSLGHEGSLEAAAIPGALSHEESWPISQQQIFAAEPPRTPLLSKKRKA